VSTELRDRLERLLMSYVKLMFVNAPLDERRPESSAASVGGSKSWVDVHEAVGRSSWFSMVGAVCVDFCIAINRTDLLFGSIYDKFAGIEKVLLTTVIMGADTVLYFPN
jgi:hypothetical protein